MSTHINAYYGAVEEAQAKVDEANAALETAQVQLQNHPDYVAPKKDSEDTTHEVEPKDSEQAVSVTVSKPKPKPKAKRNK